MTDIFGLNGKKALVVGGSAGIGEQTVLRLAKCGCDVAIGGRSRDLADAVGRQVVSMGRQAFTVMGDVTDPESTARMVAEADCFFGGIDVLVSIIGASHWSPYCETTTKFWDDEQDLNLRHFFVLSREVAKVMVKRKTGGVMTCVTSIDGIQGAPNHSAYGAAKAGLIHLVKSTATELAQHGIRVNGVGPGWIVTPRVHATENSINIIRESGVPMARMGQADEVADAILFMSSDLSSYVTGQNLMVDGGWSAASLLFRA